MQWTIAQVAGAVGSRAGAGIDPLGRVAGVSIDSRTVGAGELFVAIHGPRHDGHDHLESAFSSGAVGAVVAEAQLGRYSDEVLGRCIPVADTFKALARLATAVRESWGGKIAGVTGSVGKTTTKEILAALLGSRLRILKSEGNFNNEYGLPLTLFKLDETHQAAVLEMGMSRRGELSRLAEIARPDVGVVTRVAPAHLEFFPSVEEIALAKRELIEGLNGKESVAVLNSDDPLVAAFSSHAPGRVLSYGIERPADFRAEQIEDRGALGSTFVLVAAGAGVGGTEKRTPIELSLPGRHVIANALGAVAAAGVWEIGADEVRDVLRGLRAPSMRGELVKLTNGAALINDSYNSSPAALHAMTGMLAATPGFTRRILAAGEMRELGETSAQLHREAGEFAARTGKVDWVIGVAGDAKEIVEGAIAAGVPRANTKFFETSEQAADFLAGFVKGGDLLLVKGSRGIKMERVVEAVRAQHSSAEALTNSNVQEKVSH
jgi:UDP-N-acetylmuramoyl-tripeptide--D-alanyl-D-alanine ligase